MATQHPDNAREAFFSGRRFVSAQEEIEECYRCFAELGVEEYMWDWEGKFVDESVMDRLYSQYRDFFCEKQIGKDVFLTFRIPNIWLESSHKLPRAFMNMITAQEAARNFEMHTPPLFEVILPMTESSDQLKYIHKTFAKIAAATEEIFEMESSLKTIEVIPLFEKFEVVRDAKRILREYIEFMRGVYGSNPEYLRIFTARSDPAMNIGFLAAKVLSKLAINAYHEFGDEEGIEVYPWIGGGALPFRGGINPENVDAVIEEYAGVGSLTVQSAFRYDYNLAEAKAAIEKFNLEVPKRRKDYLRLNAEEVAALELFIEKAEVDFRETVEEIADLINEVAEKLPNHRERVQHVGLFGYSRGVGKVTLPRAIKFCGALYSLGIPPELIGSGRALLIAKEMGILDLVKRVCPYLKADFAHAGHYLNRENLEMLAVKYPSLKKVAEEISVIEDLVGVKIGPEKMHHMLHRNFASNVYFKLDLGEEFSEDVLLAAEIRKSLG